MVYVVGLGPGNTDYILPVATKILKKSTVILGFSRAIESIDFINSNKVKIKSFKEILEVINSNNSKIAIVASGDPTFFGISEYLKKNYKGQIQVIPGISSFQYLTAKINKSWSNAYTGSLHGREDEFINKVKEHDVSIWLTDKKHNPNFLCETLKKENIICEIVIGENLSYENERILVGKPEDFINKVFHELSIIIIDRRL